MEVVNKIIKYIKLYAVAFLLSGLLYACYYLIFDLIFREIDNSIDLPNYPDEFSPKSWFWGFVIYFTYFAADWWAFLLMLLIGNAVLILFRKSKNKHIVYTRLSSCILFGVCFLAIPLFLSVAFDLKTFELGAYIGKYRPLKFYLIYSLMGISVGYFIYGRYNKIANIKTGMDKS